MADAWLPVWVSLTVPLMLTTGFKDTNRFDTNVGNDDNDDDLELLETVSPSKFCLSLVTVQEIPQDEGDDVLWMKLAL